MPVCFHFAVTSAGKTAVLGSSAGLVFLQHNDGLCDKPAGQTCGCGYSHQCRLIQGCQRGLVGRAGPVDLVDPSEKQTERHFKTVE